MKVPPVLSSHPMKRPRWAMNPRVSGCARTAKQGSWIAFCVALSVLSMVMPSTESHGQVGAAADAIPMGRAQSAAPITAGSVSCKELKDAVQRSGALTIVSGPRGWSDTYYGPGVPRCEFYQTPMFSYVDTNDGACGVGYVCTQRITGGH